MFDKIGIKIYKIYAKNIYKKIYKIKDIKNMNIVINRNEI